MSPKPFRKPSVATKPKPIAAQNNGAKKPGVPAVVPAPAPVRAVHTPQTLRGFRDILPSEQKYWRFVYRKAEELTGSYGYERLDTPMLEETSLFVRSVGKQTDVVEKEMFSFLDKGNENVTLRPEGTAPMARAYINHGMVNVPQPVKLYYYGPMFRYERPQAGRFRQHTQFGVEVFGDANPVQDSEVILLAHLFYKEIGLKVAIHINSIGCNNCRPTYITELVNYYRTKRSIICEDCKRRLTKNPLRLLDCKEQQCQPVKETAPHIVDFLDEDCKNHLMRVLEYLDDLQVPYVLSPHLVRGFDYYNRTVFEVRLAEENPDLGEVSLGGGGRYDNLVELLGGRPTPACGFGIGVERVILQMKAAQIEPKDDRRPDIFLAQLGDQARRKAFNLFEELRAEGIPATANFSKGSLKGQLEIANRLGAKYTLIVGQKEVIDGTVLIRDMESGMQETVLFDKASAEMKKKLGKA
jgi:histidyl-tRNA synthetase